MSGFQAQRSLWQTPKNPQASLTIHYGRRGRPKRQGAADYEGLDSVCVSL